MKIAPLLALLLLALPRAARGANYYVDPGGSDTTGDGSMAKPWATIAYAVNSGVSTAGGDTVIVRDGTYSGVNTIQRGFASTVTVRAENDFHAVLTNVAGGEEVIRVWVDGDAHITISGLVMTNLDTSYTCPNGRETYFLVHFQDASYVTLANNILFGNNAPGTCNEILKLNRADPNAFTHDILVQGNVFYDHAPAPGADLIDSDGSSSIEIVDNIFFDNAMETQSQSFWTLKGQPAGAPAVPFPRHKLHRNVFLSWAGLPDQAFIQLGEDGLAQYEFTDALIENNLMIGDSPLQMSAPLQFKGAEGITVRANSLVGPFTAGAFGFRIGTEGMNPPIMNVTATNNLFDAPTGAMQQLFNLYGTVDVGTFGLANNLFWNDGMALPAGGMLPPSMDASKVVGDPQLNPNHAAIVLPRWDTTSMAFTSGSTTIREEFVRLVMGYGAFPQTSAAVNAADASAMPPEDILGNLRDSKPDIGAFEYGATSSADGGVGTASDAASISDANAAEGGSPPLDATSSVDSGGPGNAKGPHTGSTGGCACRASGEAGGATRAGATAFALVGACLLRTRRRRQRDVAHVRRA